MECIIISKELNLCQASESYCHGFCLEDCNGNTPLHCAALGGDKQIANKLIEAGADLDASNHELDKPIHLAANVGKIDVLKVLLDAGADLQGRGWLDNTALHVACQSAQVDLIDT